MLGANAQLSISVDVVFHFIYVLAHFCYCFYPLSAFAKKKTPCAHGETLEIL